MLRAVASVYSERSLELLAAHRRDVFKVFRTAAHSSHAATDTRTAHTNSSQTVLTTAAARGVPSPPAPAPPSPPPPPPAPPTPPPRRAWTLAAAAIALTASLGGAYFYRKMSDNEKEELAKSEGEERAPAAVEPGELYPAHGSELPARVQFLVAGGGTAAFAALRALRAARPDATLLLVGAERAPPYMRPPLSKELWRQPDLPAAARDPLRLGFTQWNGKRRSLVYEPLSFYTPLSKLKEGGAGAGLARGWRVARLDLAAREAELRAPGLPPATVAFESCLIATGSVPKRLEALAPAAEAGRALTLHSVADAARLAGLLAEPATRRVVVVGGGLLATELAAALAERLRAGGGEVLQLYRERAPLQDLLPHYLAADAARRLADLGVLLAPDSEVESSVVRDGRVHMRVRRGRGEGEGEAREVAAECVVQCVGAEPAAELARAAGLELDERLGGVLVNAELQARSGVWAAGDAASFHDATLGRRRVTHHDHAVLSGRRAAQNMAGDKPPEPYTHQSMFWSDLGPALGYEAIGIIDSQLPTVGVFSTDAVSDAAAPREAGAGAGEGGAGGGEGGAGGGEGGAGGGEGGEGGARRYERGVVFYLRERRVVGVLLWNLFNRMHVARQVLAQGEFDDLFEVAKLFSPHEED